MNMYNYINRERNSQGLTMKGLLCFALFALQCSLFTSCHDDLDVDTIANAPLLTRGYTDEQIRCSVWDMPTMLPAM